MSDKCLKCGGDSMVRDTRLVKNNDLRDEAIRRRRACLDPKCGTRWTTLEVRAVGKGGEKLQTQDTADIVKRVNAEVAKKLMALSKKFKTR